MFDAEKNVKLDGTDEGIPVDEPAQLDSDVWSEGPVRARMSSGPSKMGGPAGLAVRLGSEDPHSPAMKVSAIIHPLKDGTRGGQFYGHHASRRHREGQRQRSPERGRRRN
jgi:hypothetical protein